MFVHFHFFLALMLLCCSRSSFPKALVMPKIALFDPQPCCARFNGKDPALPDVDLHQEGENVGHGGRGVGGVFSVSVKVILWRAGSKPTSGLILRVTGGTGF